MKHFLANTISGKICGTRDTSSYTSCKLILNFPGKITSFDIGTQIDDDTVEINMLKAWDNTPDSAFAIEVEVAQPNYTIFVVAGIGALLVIGVVVGIIIRKRRGQDIVDNLM